jgi:hypothetical protein
VVDLEVDARRLKALHCDESKNAATVAKVENLMVKNMQCACWQMIGRWKRVSQYEDLYAKSLLDLLISGPKTELPIPTPSNERSVIDHCDPK